MVCYAVPLAALVVAAFTRKALNSTGAHGLWLNLMLLGGALFGVVDHFWNRELFLLGANWMMDLGLGFTITLGTLGCWGILVHRDRLAQAARGVERATGVYK